MTFINIEFPLTQKTSVRIDMPLVYVPAYDDEWLQEESAEQERRIDTASGCIVNARIRTKMPPVGTET